MPRGIRQNDFAALLASLKERFRFDPQSAELSADERAAMRRWLRGRAAFQALVKVGDALIYQAEWATSARRIESLLRASHLLLSLPLPEAYASAGRYFLRICNRWQGPAYWPAAQAEFHKLAETAPLRFQARAMYSLAITAAHTGDRQAEIEYYLEAGRLAASGGWCDPFTTFAVELQKGIWKSQEGDHHGALAHLERLMPLARVIGRDQPANWYVYLNSLAVELMEVGRLDEAHNLSRTVISSPFGPAFFEWRETYVDILARAQHGSRSLVAFSRPVLPVERPRTTPTQEAMRLPARAPVSTAKPKQPPATVLAFRKPSPAVPAPHAEMSPRQMLLRLMELISTDGLGREELRRMVAALEQIVGERRKEPRPQP